MSTPEWYLVAVTTLTCFTSSPTHHTTLTLLLFFSTVPLSLRHSVTLSLRLSVTNSNPYAMCVQTRGHVSHFKMHCTFCTLLQFHRYASVSELPALLTQATQPCCNRFCKHTLSCPSPHTLSCTNTTFFSLLPGYSLDPSEYPPRWIDAAQVQSDDQNQQHDEGER